MKKVFNIFLLVIDNLILLYGVIFLNWDFLFMLFIIGYEWLLISVLYFLKIKKNGGSKLFYRLLPIDKEYYKNIKITYTKSSSPFINYAMCLAIWNFHIIYSIYFLLTIFEIKSMIFIILLAINQLIVVSNINIDSKDNLINFASTPIRNILFVGIGILAGGVFAKIFGGTIYILIGLVFVKTIIDILPFTNYSLEFNKSILSFSGVKFKK